MVSGHESAQSFDEIISRTIEAQSQRPNIDFAFIVGYLPKPEAIDGISKCVRRAAEKNMKITLGDYGAGDAWLSVMSDTVGYRSFYSDKDSTPKGVVTCLVDGDQFNINDGRVLDGIGLIAD